MENHVAGHALIKYSRQSTVKAWTEANFVALAKKYGLEQVKLAWVKNEWGQDIPRIINNMTN